MKGVKRINSFLIEIIVVILFFSLSVAIILQVFVATHKREQQSLGLNMAVILTQNLTEEYRANGTGNSWCSSPETEDGSTVYTLYYNDKWEQVSTGGSYKMYFTVNETSDDVGTSSQTVAKLVSLRNSGSEETVYTLSSQHYSANA